MKYNLLWSYLVLKELNKLSMCFLELHEMICADLVAVGAKEDLRVALWLGRGDAAYLQEPGIAIIIALSLSAFLHVQNGSDMVQPMSWFQALKNCLILLWKTRGDFVVVLSGLVVGFFNRCLKVLRPVLFARLFKTVLHALASSEGNWQYYCEVTLNKKRTTTKGKKKNTHHQRTHNQTFLLRPLPIYPVFT